MKIEIKIPMVGLLSLSMAYPISRLESDCTGMGSQIIKHLIKIYAYPSSESVNAWKREIANKFLSPFDYATKSKAKPDRVKHWMFGREISTYYDWVVDNMEYDKPEKTYVEIATKLEATFKRIASEVANNANKKHPVVFTSSQVSTWIRP